MSPEDDAMANALMVRAQLGEQPAYEEVLHLLARQARRFVGRRVGDAAFAEDVVQEILLTVHRMRHTYDPARPVGPWFYAIAQSRLVDGLRGQRRVLTAEVADEEMLAELAAAPDAGWAHTRVGEALAQAVARLPRVQREVVSLLKYEDLSVREMAHRLGMSETAVKTTAHRSYKVLRRMLQGAIG
jgi:RNA polymerase sigma-70 factor (ECF subfamily)